MDFHSSPILFLLDFLLTTYQSYWFFIAISLFCCQYCQFVTLVCWYVVVHLKSPLFSNGLFLFLCFNFLLLSPSTLWWFVDRQDKKPCILLKTHLHTWKLYPSPILNIGWQAKDIDIVSTLPLCVLHHPSTSIHNGSTAMLVIQLYCQVLCHDISIVIMWSHKL